MKYRLIIYWDQVRKLWAADLLVFALAYVATIQLLNYLNERAARTV